ncbi:hypothetical protein [Egicoccus sp. AB-alg2]|uniref:hypothetical protein n=1 Tax=Egicoccus sp. AB-alg2 TaxID=3242693 RepID=UPI00359E2C07
MNGIDLSRRHHAPGPLRTRLLLLAGLLLTITVVVLAATGVTRIVTAPAADEPSPLPGTGPDTGVDVYRGVGTWIDVYDYVPARQAEGLRPPIRPEDLLTAVAAGVSTVYLQAADQSAPGVVDAALVGAFLRAAHEAGLNVVGWYLPTFADPDADLGRLQAILDFSYEGHQFDGVAVDIEDVRAVPDAQERNERLTALSAALGEAADGRPVGAIVPAPVLLEDVNPALWPDFPWADLAPHYGAWLVMNYWTGRTESSGWRDAYRYTVENVVRLRARLTDDRVPVHLVGGVADEASDEDYARFASALAELDPVGASLYDFRTSSVSGLLTLRRLGADGVWGGDGLREGGDGVQPPATPEGTTRDAPSPAS